MGRSYRARGWTRPEPEPRPGWLQRQYPNRCRGPLVGPHNQCSHGVAPPAGYQRCPGDPACPVLIPVVWQRQRGVTHCFWHERDAAVMATTTKDRYEELMGVRL